MKVSELIDDLKAHVCGESDIWDVLTALRSCDGGSWELKNLTTSRIRGFFLLETGSAYFESRLTPLTPDERKKRDIQLHVVSPHFRLHYTHAVSVIKKYYKYDLHTERRVARKPANKKRGKR